ncbi:energy transducer TonB [Pectobacterium brasiliense]|uniref:TonB family protein n=1 Tax=Pectobacterium brasiliense TaxID=180957 RepID=UPI0001A44760|nr:TonB family protein [Pectobacterium brasiliense]KGA25169.1 energy transducer TonB [Pectobacterium brasiliense]KRF63103.1 energy transducer TonB [Pectobacterium brasiliense]MBN3186321.1 TonB family protein [Pectobacterium brasiliense]QHG27134.1 TonB family protein [Pectobacterium brasiliense]
MSRENLQGALLGANRTGRSVLLGSRPLAHSYPTSALTADVPNWRSLAFFVLSCVAHALLAVFFLLHYSPKENIEDMAGNAGGSMQVTMMAAAMSQAADTSPPVADPPVAQPTPVVMPILTPLPEHPNPVIKQPVIERKPVAEKKPPVREKKQPEKKPEEKPKEQLQARTQRTQQTEKKSESPVATAQTGDAPSPMPSSVGMPGSAATAKAGESDSGQAARGAGKSNSQNFKALHRRVNYPARAKALGVEGKVRVKFDITGSGTVTNVQILSETPDGVFGDDVMKDMARWRYRTEAPVENQVVSIVFKLNGHIQVDD